MLSNAVSVYIYIRIYIYIYMIIYIYRSVCTHTYTLHPHFDRFGPRLEKDLDAATNNARADSASWLPMGASSLKKCRGN